MSKKLYVGNLPYSVTDASLKEMFSQFGEVISANIIMDKVRGVSKGFGFVEMSDGDAAKAISSLNGSEELGRKMVVNEARPMEPRAPRGEYGNRGDRGGRSW